MNYIIGKTKMAIFFEIIFTVARPQQILSFGLEQLFSRSALLMLWAEYFFFIYLFN